MMKKIALTATAALALTACGETTDASDEAQADTVEVDADAAMEDMPEPIEDDGAMEESLSDVDVEGQLDAAEAEAEAAADDAAGTAAAAEAALEELEGGEAE